MRVTFTKDDTVQVFRLGTTTNKKIAEPKEKIVQSYTFSRNQYEYIRYCMNKGKKPVFKEFFSMDAQNCFDCPFSMNTGGGGCYTHKVMQYSGFVSMLKSLVKEYGTYTNIQTYNGNEATILVDLLTIAKDRYVRFGTYGEPSLHPTYIVDGMSQVAKNWTGYTHQWFKKPEYAKWFMASVHTEIQANKAEERLGYRSFIASDNNDMNAIKCPASKEAGFVSNCSKCGLCSGANGKGKKNVVILEH